MLRSDRLPVWSQQDIREQEDKMRSLGGELIDARTEFLLCGNDVNAKNEQIRKLGPAGGAQYIKLTGELRTLQEKQQTAEREVKRITAEIEKLRIGRTRTWSAGSIFRKLMKASIGTLTSAGSPEETVWDRSPT